MKLKPPWAGRLLRVARVLLVAYLLVVLLMMLIEESLILFEDAWFEAADGVKLHGWFVPHDAPRAVALFAHGNAGNITHRDDLLRELHRLGVAVLAFDYRGYGRSSGSPSEDGVLADARAARDWLANRAGVPASQIVLMGESIGGAVMTLLAAEQGARGLVLENTFPNAPDVAAFHYPWLPVRMLMRTRLDAAAAIGRYHGPLLQVHGDADTIVPIALGRKLFEAANEPKQFVVIPGADHNDPRAAGFYQALDQFLAQ
jgi:fermentation-respiration switch protein FrsA (DUF1100 family)